ncbi:hypothetical protein [Ferrovibrio sp.]|uniref:hypothetical protein n=1 Tax=Ferrovibrio sp. TaxID=1917215 RepID=UPI001B51F09C|nr:hypothetical protein [Ferrovibrio sp.]MBP7066372.1 hypothetical protein [Ferrovibrio sp.]
MPKMGSGRKAAPFLFKLILFCAFRAAAQPTELVPGTSEATGAGLIAKAWFADSTTRYAHGALGDSIEAGTLVLQDRAGVSIRIVLPEERVFEDLAPRLVTVPALGDAAMVIESDRRLGARLSFYGMAGGQGRLLAATPFIGTGNRWLAPIGVGDFDGDGMANEVALVAMPHLAGLLRVYHIQAGELPLLAEAAGYSNHVYGRAEIAMAAVDHGQARDRILLPDRQRRRLVLMSLADGRLREERVIQLSAPLLRLRNTSAGFEAELEDGSVLAGTP